MSINSSWFDGENVFVYHWAPPKEDSYENFGDEIGPLIVQRIAEKRLGRPVNVRSPEKGRPKLLAVGSVVQKASAGDTIWGSGINGKSWPRNLEGIGKIDVRSVRGPLTQQAMTRLGVKCPSLYGDPGLLFPRIFKEDIERISVPQYEGAIIYLPNLNDDRFLDQSAIKSMRFIRYLSPNNPPAMIARAIQKAALVISSSLHGIVFADALGTPVVPLLSQFEPMFKYVDYYEGTGRSGFRCAFTIDEALDSMPLPKLNMDVDTVMNAFPFDLLTAQAG